jgi:GrpB-like predicted nucleotidyltransferase (UPF0157 family)
MKQLLGDSLTLRDYDGQVAEAMAMVRALNRMTKADARKQAYCLKIHSSQGRSHEILFIQQSRGDMQIAKHLAFRDYLINNKEVADQYAAIKRAAALESDNDIHRYSALKADFIANHLRLALLDLDL